MYGIGYYEYTVYLFPILMKKFIVYILGCILSGAVILSLIIYGILSFPKEAYSDDYTQVIQRKYDYFLQCKEPKIVIISGSSAGFGIDESLIEYETGYKVCNLGLHAGFGAIVPTELSKANINEGDIVLLGYEWGWLEQGYFDTLGTDLVMCGFGDRFDMYAQLPYNLYPKFLGYLPEYAEKKASYTPITGVYTSSSFDNVGRMTLERSETTMEYEGNESYYGYIEIDTNIPVDVVEYLNEYKAYVESKNAKVYFISCPTYEKAIDYNTEDIQTLIKNEESMCGIPYISNPEDYLFPLEWMFDTIYHCNDEGELHRTELLISDLRNAGVIH